jgi:hypothetical protein
MSITGACNFLLSAPIIGLLSTSKDRLIEQYNNSIIKNKRKTTSELRFGLTSSGGIGFTLRF